jgi:signal transduction histidine kinase
VWPELFELADAARLGLLWLCVAALALKILPWRGWATVKPVIDTSRHADIAGMAAAAASVMVVGALVNLPLWVAGAGAIGVALVYAPVRQWTGRALDRLLVSDQREQARIAAVEDERFRLASEIHDVPLQEISGVIRRLERIDGAESEADLLRDVAEHLRDITGELHPPVLADLGLVPALRAATEEADRLGPPSVVCQLDEDTGLLADQRLPRTVELAVYRIVQEAIAHARLHAGASSVLVSGRVSPRWLEVAVRDDGAGLDQSALRAAQRLGHLGVTSMLQRAEAIGAELRIEPASPGTTVTLEWSLG